MNIKKSLGRSLQDFEPLKPSEKKLLVACQKGQIAELGDAVPQSASSEQSVRASFVRFLLLGGDDSAPIHERGVRLSGALVEGRLDLQGSCILANVGLTYCRFDNTIVATDARVDGLFNLHGSYVVGGLVADRLYCSASVFLSGGFKTTGEVRLIGAQIDGDIDCSGGLFEEQEGRALNIDRANIRGTVFLRNGFKAIREVRLLSAQIGGDMDCSDGLFEVNEGNAMSADRVSVKGSVFLRGGFKATGVVRLLGAQIGGNLDCNGGQFEVTSGLALPFDGAHIKGTVFLRDGFKATGIVRLLGAQIGGNLDCSGGQFEVRDGHAFNADRANVKGSVMMRGGFEAKGEFRLLGARIGGDVDCSGGNFLVNEGNALSADRVNVQGSVFFRDGFSASGLVRLIGAQIGGNLACNGGRFETSADAAAISLASAEVRGAWQLYDTSKPVRIDASHLEVAVLVDELAAWAPGSVLDGLRYGALGGRAPTNGIDRLKWLCNQSEDHLGETAGGGAFRPQPWRQVQSVLRETGHAEDAKLVGIAFEDRLRAIGKIGQSPVGTHWFPALIKRGMACCAHYTFGALAGYGYRPLRLVIWMVAVWFVSGSLYWWLALPPRSAMAPSDPLVFQNASYTECLPDNSARPGNWYLCSPLRGEYATFSPLAYSLDLMLPLVDLGQEKTWGAFVRTPKTNPVEELFLHWHWGHAVRLLTWFETLFGWLSSLLLVAIVSGFSRRNDES